MKKLTLTSVTVAIGLLLSAPVFAFGPGGDMGPGYHTRMPGQKVESFR